MALLRGLGNFPISCRICAVLISSRHFAISFPNTFHSLTGMSLLKSLKKKILVSKYGINHDTHVWYAFC